MVNGILGQHPRTLDLLKALTIPCALVGASIWFENGGSRVLVWKLGCWGRVS